MVGCCLAFLGGKNPVRRWEEGVAAPYHESYSLKGNVPKVFRSCTYLVSQLRQIRSCCVFLGKPHVTAVAIKVTKSSAVAAADAMPSPGLHPNSGIMHDDLRSTDFCGMASNCRWPGTKQSFGRYSNGCRR